MKKTEDAYQLANLISQIYFDNSEGPVVAIGRKKTVLLHWACMKIAEKIISRTRRGVK